MQEGLDIDLSRVLIKKSEENIFRIGLTWDRDSTTIVLIEISLCVISEMTVDGICGSTERTEPSHF